MMYDPSSKGVFNAIIIDAVLFVVWNTFVSL